MNAFIFLVFIVAVCYCCYGDLSWLTNVEQRRRQADAEYQAHLREREDRRKKARIMSPEKRRRLLLASFRRHQVSMVRIKKKTKDGYPTCYIFTHTLLILLVL